MFEANCGHFKIICIGKLKHDTIKQDQTRDTSREPLSQGHWILNLDYSNFYYCIVLILMHESSWFEGIYVVTYRVYAMMQIIDTFNIIIILHSIE